jgi:hypothetical protein
VHVLQISSINQGLTKFLYNLFGEQVTVGVFGLYVPYWFIEGDPVVSETALSEAGRGRDPNFEMELRAQLLEIGPYSLEKASLGSYRHFTTDRYHLGYYLVGQGRAHFGRDMWNKPMANVGRYPLAIVPFSTGIQTKTKMTKKPFYEWALKDLTKKWSVQLAKTQPDNVEELSAQKTFTNYSQNAWMNDGRIFSLKENYHGIGQFVLLDRNGEENTIMTPGYYMKDRISIGGDYIGWVEIKYDPRWSNRKNTKLITFNYKTRKKETIISKARYFSPQLSPSGEQIAVIEVDEFNKNYLVVLNREDGAIIERIAAPVQTSLSHPSWNVQEEQIVVEALGLEGKTLLIADMKAQKWTSLLPWQSTHILNPRFWDKYILFEASYNGIMNIYALDTETQSLFQTTNVAFGAGDYQIHPDGNEILFSNYSSLGKVVATQKWNPKDWIPFSEVQDHRYPLADILSQQEDTVMQSAHIPQNEYPVKKYSKVGHLFNIHSWNILNLDAENGSINPGISVLSQNKLGTMTAQMGADYSYNTDAMRYYAQVDYLGLYPAISLGANYGRRWTNIVEHGDTTYHSWQETNMNASVYVPLIYTSGTWAHRIQPQIGFQYKQIDQGSELDFNYRNIKSAVYGLDYSAQLKSPFQNIFPRWGYAVSVAYRESIMMSEPGNMLLAGASVYLPGVFRHDGFRVLVNYQDKSGDAHFFSDWASPARGYTDISYNDLLTIRADYVAPLFYPDFSMGSLIYFKRVTMGLFYDNSRQTDLSTSQVYRNYNDFWSAGIDLTTTVHFFRSKFPFEIGLRSIYVNGYKKNPEAMVYQLLWSVGI